MDNRLHVSLIYRPEDIQKVTNRKKEEIVKINTTLPNMEDRNFSNPLKIGIRFVLFTKDFFKRQHDGKDG